MKILAVADTVIESLVNRTNRPADLATVDLIIGCGDLPPEYLAALRNSFEVPLYYILGNHDLRFGNSPPTGCANIHRRLITYRGLRIAGFSGSRWYNGNENQYTEEQMRSHIRHMWFSLWRKGVDLVVTHAPPRYINDLDDPCHKGFHAFRHLLTKYRPRLLLHGHIHAHFNDDAEREQRFGATRVINCYGYHTIEIDKI